MFPEQKQISSLAQSTGIAKRFALTFIAQVNLTSFWEERRVKIIMVILELENIDEGYTIKCLLHTQKN